MSTFMSGTLLLPMSGSHPLHLLIIVYLQLAGQMASAIYEGQKCYCVEDEDETIRQVIANFTDTPPVSEYEYIGAKYNGSDFEPCVCGDVVGVVTQLAVTEPYVLELAKENPDELNSNITKALDAAAKAAFSNDISLKHSYHSSFASYNETSDTKAIFGVEFIVKGSDPNLKEKVASVMMEALSEDVLDGIGAIDNFTVEFSLKVCPEDPDAGPNTMVVSSTNNMAGTSVTFTCKTGYRNPGETRTAESKCTHANLTWTPPSQTLTCVEDKRCYQPPPSPRNTKRVWDGQIEEGTKITYNCRNRYKILTSDSSTYQCQDKAWTLVSSEIDCKPPKCADPPQVPDHGVLIYNAWDEITYQCDTYAIRSGINFKHKIWCKNFTWEELPESFKCIGSATYSAHQDLENFLNITLPVSAVLIFLIVLCLLGTRADSPVCKICKGSVKEVF